MPKREQRGKRKEKEEKGWQKKQKKKFCVFCKENIAFVDYKDVSLLRKFISDRGKIRARRVSGARAADFEHPDLIVEACARLRVPPAAAMLIGDSTNDAQAAHAAGASSVLVETGYNEGESVHDLAGAAGVNGIFPSLFAAAEWILATAPRARPLPAASAPVPGSARRAALP